VKVRHRFQATLGTPQNCVSLYQILVANVNWGGMKKLDAQPRESAEEMFSHFVTIDPHGS
jgi:hypothetical protein